MTDQSTESHASERRVHRTRANEIVSNVTEHSPSGSASMLLGGALVVRALQSQRKGRSLLYALGGAGLVAFGVRRRRSRTDESTQESDHLDAGDTGTSEQRSDSHQIDINPRGTDDEPDIETETGPDEGSIQFTEDRPEEPRAEPDLDEPAPEDPRLDDDDDITEIDLSEAAMADEASEAAGPAPEQAQPVQTEGTEPEPTPEADSSHMDVDEGAGETDKDMNGEDDVAPGDEQSDNDAASKAGETAETDGDTAETTGETDSDDEDTETNRDGSQA